MGLGDRFSQWVDERAEAWGDRFGKWFLDRTAAGIYKAFEDMEPGIIDQTRETIRGVIDNPNTTPEMKRVLEKSLEEGDIWTSVLGWTLTIIGIIPALLGLGQPIGNRFNHAQEFVIRSQIFEAETALRLWRRDKAAYDKYLEDLKLAGWTDDRIEALKVVTEFLPPAQDLITWQAREVFEPRKREQYGLDDDAGTLERSLFYKLGFTDEQINNYWAAHWEHSSFIQMVEMIRRGLLTGDRAVPVPPETSEEWNKRDEAGMKELYEWYGLVEIAPYWRSLLSELVWEVPTRVDVRRWWDMRTITEDQLRSIYHRQGYHGEDLENYIRWTKVYTDYPTLIARWSKGWITLEDVRQQLLGLGIPEERVQQFIEEKVQAEKPARTESDRDLTRTDIIKGVKQERITRDEAIELLVDLGYDNDEADYILSVNIPEDEVDTAVQQRQLTKSDIIKGLRTDVLTEDEARQRLLELRYSAADTQLLLDIFKASIEPPSEETGRQESKTDVITAVKKGLITPEEGYLRLQDIGFTPEASEFILWVQAESSPFSPTTYNEFKELTGKWKRAAGREVTEMPEELKTAADELVRISKEVEDLETAVEAEEANVIGVEEVPPEAEARLKELQVFLTRARNEKTRIQGEYDRLVAEFKQRG